MLPRAVMTCMLLAALLRPGAAVANDSIAELGMGGLILSCTDAVAMQSEDLFVSAKEIRVDYVFRNQSQTDVGAIVAFPMPDIEGSPYVVPALPDQARDNFLDFEVSVGRRPVAPKLEQRASAGGIDVTEELKRAGVPPHPFGDAAFAALAALPDDVAADWTDRGLIVPDTYEDGSGSKTVRTPFWLLRSTYWWRAFFPAGKDIAVSHRYKPSVGASVGTSFLMPGADPDEIERDYQSRYCIDQAFESAMRQAAESNADGFPPFSEIRIRYVLRSGGNWAQGTIGSFHLTVDKGDPKALISFCAEGVGKTGATAFEVRAQDFAPGRDLDILILLPMEDTRPVPGGRPSRPVEAD